MKVTLTDIQQIAGLRWDVDISDDVGNLILPEIVEKALEYNNKEKAINDFLYELIGEPARVDAEKGFIASAFVKIHGKDLTLENLPKKEWKTFDEIPRQPARTRKRKGEVRFKPSENHARLNEILIKGNCHQLHIENFQMQLGIIADSEIDFDTIEVETRGEQTIFSIQNGVKILTVDMIANRCAIRYFGNSPITKVYAHKAADVIRAVEWLNA